MSEENARLQDELDLLLCMYPDQLQWDNSARELRYSTENGKLHVRVLDGYLRDTLPLVLSATIRNDDVRTAIRERVSTKALGEEVLDSIIAEFDDLCISSTRSKDANVAVGLDTTVDSIATAIEPQVTIIVWLHHLLNTNKRKQALSPNSLEVSGVTKPGYPGVLLYSGPSQAVREHVNELKSLNWQAFQIRSEIDYAWTLAHGEGVIEVESMKDIVADIAEAEKEKFLEAMRMK